MKKLIILLVVVFFLFSCEKDVYYNIPRSEKTLLKSNDTVVFIDKENQLLDTFLIKRTDEYQIYDKNYYYENILVWYKKMGKSTSEKNIFVQQGTTTSISVDGNYFPTIYENDNTININVNNIDYPSVFVLSTTYFPDSLPNKVYYSYKYGIIMYEFSDGRYYQLNSKIH